MVGGVKGLILATKRDSEYVVISQTGTKDWVVDRVVVFDLVCCQEGDRDVGVLGCVECCIWKPFLIAWVGLREVL